MLFLLLCNAAPAMSREWGPDDKEHSPRQIWIEICSQILNALFCITGLGLFPTRLRDLYRFYRGYVRGNEHCRDKILKTHAWFWPSISPRWKLELVVWCYIVNSLFQVALCVVMWHFNRFNRPPWATGLLIGLSFMCVIVAGVVTYLEIRRLKAYRRVEETEIDQQEMALLEGQKNLDIV